MFVIANIVYITDCIYILVMYLINKYTEEHYLIGFFYLTGENTATEKKRRKLLGSGSGTLGS